MGGGEDVRGRRAAAKWEWARGRQKRIGIEGERAVRAGSRKMGTDEEWAVGKQTDGLRPEKADTFAAAEGREYRENKKPAKAGGCSETVSN